jgi:hypothetical protein
MALCSGLKEGDSVVVTHLPPGWTDDLPEEDQEAIRLILGKPIRFEGYEENDRAEVSFVDDRGHIHFMYLRSEFVGPLAP